MRPTKTKRVLSMGIDNKRDDTSYRRSDKKSAKLHLQLYLMIIQVTFTGKTDNSSLNK